MATLADLSWANGAARLPEAFHESVRPTPVPDPYPVAWNPLVAAQLGLTHDLSDTETLQILAGNRVLPAMDPVAMAYAGHQFGSWVPELGDGRAITLGEVTTASFEPAELQLKGAGMTRWSRMGDGRAVLRSTIREYLASAAMRGLGVPTTRALSIVGSDLPVFRERTETAAVLTRVAPSHVRFGSFEYVAARRMYHEQRILADHVIDRFYPHFLKQIESERYAAWLGEIIERTAHLMADWIAVGFSHGVMNTDNFSIIGLTLDYGPYGWMDNYQPGFVCNHTDWAGRYAYNQQPRVGLWNCARLAEALHPLVSEEQAMAALNRYQDAYELRVTARFASKLGLATVTAGDGELIGDFLGLLEQSGADFALSFRALSRYSPGGDASRAALAELISATELPAWLERYDQRLSLDARDDVARHAAMLAVNPKYVLRNWVAEDVIRNAEHRNFALVDQVRTLLDDPFAEHPGWERYAASPPDWAKGIEVSCSS